jgi:hypothetical protein
MTYRQAVNWAEDIKTYSEKRIMPPWKPTVGDLEFQNDRRLSDKEIKTLSTWVDAGMPEGEAKDAPPTKNFIEGWELGQPDLILSPSAEYTLAGDGPEVYRCFVMPTNLKEDVYVRAVEYRPGNPRVVHHILTLIDLSGKARKLEKATQDSESEKLAKAQDSANMDHGPGYSANMNFGFLPQAALQGWAPGIRPRYFSEESALLLPKGSDIVMQLHYHRDGRTEKDQTKLGLYFAKKPVKKIHYGGAVAGMLKNAPIPLIFFRIPPGEENFQLNQGQAFAGEDLTLYSIMPHMHLLGKSIKIAATYEGVTRKLLEIPAWDYNWQEEYILKEPLQVKKGTKFSVEAVYDNSSKNPLNPFSPPKEITWGEETDKEMCFVFLGGWSEKPIHLGPSRMAVLPLMPTPPRSATVKKIQ